jgi:oxygen-dependent protoporphyrinogen oxidase
MSVARVDSVVVGAGVAGLAAALELQSAGDEVFVIDPSDRPGGACRTDHVGGYVVERGANTVLVKPPMRAFLEQRRLDETLVAAAPASRRRYLVRDGALERVPMSPLALAKTPLLTTAGKLRLLAEPFVWRRKKREESVAEFIGRRLGKQAVSALVAPFLTGVYAGDENQLGARAVFGSLVEGDERFGSITLGAGIVGALRRGPRGLPGSHSSQAGLGPFARKLAEQLAEPPALGSRVVSLGRDTQGFRVDVTSGSGDLSVTAARVVVATPSLEAGTLLRGVDGELARTLEDIEYAPIASVPLGFAPADVDTPIDGFGFLVPREEGLGLLGCLYMSQLFSGRAPEGRQLLHCMLGGVRWPEAAHLSDAELVARACEDLDRVLGLQGSPDPLGVARWPRAVPQPGRDHVARMRWVKERLVDFPGLALAGAYVAGVSVSDSLASGVAAARQSRAKGLVGA